MPLLPLLPDEPLLPLLPEDPLEPLLPDEPLLPEEPLEPDEPLVPEEPLEPAEPLLPEEPVAPEVPLEPAPELPLEPEEPAAASVGDVEPPGSPKRSFVFPFAPLQAATSRSVPIGSRANTKPAARDFIAQELYRLIRGCPTPTAHRDDSFVSPVA